MNFSKQGYIKQIMLYLENKDYQKALSLSKDFLKFYPDDLESNYLYSTSCFWTMNFLDSIKNGRIAFNKAKSKDELIATAIVISSSYYRIGEYENAIKILKPIESLKFSIDVEKLMLTLSIALKNKKEALRHAKNLHVLNEEAANEMLKKYLK